MLFDTHAHYDDDQFDGDRETLLASLPEQGVGLVVNPGCTAASSRTAVELARRFPHVYAAVGIHPENCGDFRPEDLDAIRALAREDKVVAIGEIGLDYYWPENPPRPLQQQVLRSQLALARELDIPVTMVTDTYQFPMGQAMLTIYPPVGAGDLNEQGLTFLCSAGDFDALITGDMAGNTEKKLVERVDLPDIEVRVVGHHGSRYSSTDAFLQQVRPETAIISVGDNGYGHPTQEAMDRLSRNGAAVYRTDRQGNVLVTVNGGT